MNYIDKNIFNLFSVLNLKILRRVCIFRDVILYEHGISEPDKSSYDRTVEVSA